MLNIRELTSRENKLLSRIHEINGSMNEKSRQLKEGGIFEFYRELHKDYSSLAATGDIEALKRAIFIQWYSVVEPACFSGIPSRGNWGDGLGLDIDTERMILNLVEKAIFSNNSDGELEWMIAWYYQISEYYFDAVWSDSGLTEKLRFINQKSHFLSNKKVVEPLENRGQMGEYFLSILSQFPKS